MKKWFYLLLLGLSSVCASLNAKEELSLLSYNLFLLPEPKGTTELRAAAKILGVSDPVRALDTKQVERANKIPAAIAKVGPDIVLFQEGFHNDARKILKQKLKELGYVYATKGAGGRGPIKSGGRLTGSGLLTMSRDPWKIKDFKLIYFQDKFPKEEGLLKKATRFWKKVTQSPEIESVGSDLIADKGVLYVKVKNKDTGKKYHIFSTHTQAGGRTSSEKKKGVELREGEISTGGKIRQKHLKRIAAFIKSLDIPKEDAVIIAGDLNIDKTGRPDRWLEYLEIPKILKATEVSATKGSLDYTSPERKVWIDYAYVPDNYRKPKEASVTVLDEFGDLSDHYPLLINLEY